MTALLSSENIFLSFVLKCSITLASFKKISRKNGKLYWILIFPLDQYSFSFPEICVGRYVVNILGFSGGDGIYYCDSANEDMLQF